VRRCAERAGISSSFTPVRAIAARRARDHHPWSEIVGALRDVDYHGPVVIEAFTPKIKEIARAVSIWRRWRRARTRSHPTDCGI
jgi:hypothetical protein